VKALVVFAGGGAGSVARWAIALGMARALGPAFPWGTLTVNVLGSAALGVLLEIALVTEAIAPLPLLALTTGFMGGFTTYSTFNAETLQLLRAGAWGTALLYAGLTGASCLAGAAAGVAAVRALGSP
jgi:CrcB protein